MCLVGHGAGQHRGASVPLYLHPFEQERERFAQFAADD